MPCALFSVQYISQTTTVYIQNQGKIEMDVAVYVAR